MLLTKRMPDACSSLKTDGADSREIEAAVTALGP